MPSLDAIAGLSVKTINREASVRIVLLVSLIHEKGSATWRSQAKRRVGGYGRPQMCAFAVCQELSGFGWLLIAVGIHGFVFTHHKLFLVYVRMDKQHFNLCKGFQARGLLGAGGLVFYRSLRQLQ